jgi:protein tyrosine/serine phosphatase
MSIISAFPNLSELLKTPINDPIPSDQVKLVLSSAPFIPVPSALNTRAISSASFKANHIYRSGKLSHLPASSLAILKSQYNITTIYDLRSHAERTKTPSSVFEGIETIWVRPALSGSTWTEVSDEGVGEVKKREDRVFKAEEFITNEGVDGVIKLYGNILESHKEPFKAVFNRLKAGTEGAVLFHCTGELSPSHAQPYFRCTEI